MKIFNHKKNGVTKRFVRVASAHRREVGVEERKLFDWSPEAMKAQYDAESTGDLSGLHKRNGYAYGAHLYGITLEAMGQDISEGLFSKFELMKGSCAHKRAAIRQMCPKTHFADVWKDKIIKKAKTPFLQGGDETLKIFHDLTKTPNSITN